MHQTEFTVVGADIIRPRATDSRPYGYRLRILLQPSF